MDEASGKLAAMANLMILAGFVAGGLAFIWAVQTLALLSLGAGRPVALPFWHGHDSPRVRWALKLALQAVLASLLLVYPGVLGSDPFDYHFFRLAPARWSMLIET